MTAMSSEQLPSVANTAKRLLPWVVFAGIAVMLALAGFWLLFTTFMVYDDEGYVLLSLKNFSEHGGLYDQVYTQYGPFPYLLYDALHRALGFAFTNTAGRWITWVAWLGTAGACAALVGRRTRSPLWAGFTLAGVFIYLWPMIHEPIHPGGLISLMVALGAWLGSEAWEAGRIRTFSILTALIGAAMMLTKINVGLFFMGAAFSLLALNTQKKAAARALTWLGAIGCAALPFVLMQALFEAPWVRLYALVFTGGALAVLLAARMSAKPVVTPSSWAWFIGVALGTVAILSGLMLIRGTTLRGLADGVLLEPFKHPNVYFFPMRWRIGTGVLALGSLALAAWTARNNWLKTPLGRTIITVALIATGCVFLCLPLGIISTSPATWGMCYAITLAWLCVVPLGPDDRGTGTRVWIALLLVFQFLHAYPVAGSQINWGTYLWVPLLALGLHNAWPVLADMLGTWRRPARIIAGLALVAATLIMSVRLAQIGWNRYHLSQPLGLPGTENIRLTDETTYDLRIMTENLRAHADMLMGFPGLYSVNLWTGLPTPTLANATHWFSLLSVERQQAIIARMARSPRAVLLVQRDVLDYLATTGFATRGPLHEWLMGNFQCAFAVDGYEFWVRQGRQIAPLDTARFSPGPTGSRELTLTLSAPALPVSSIEVCDLNARHLPLLTLDATSAKAFVEPIDFTGNAIGPSQPVAFPLRLAGLNRLVLRFADNGDRIDRTHALIVLRDAAGMVLSEAREIN